MRREEDGTCVYLRPTKGFEKRRQTTSSSAFASTQQFLHVNVNILVPRAGGAQQRQPSSVNHRATTAVVWQSDGTSLPHLTQRYLLPTCSCRREREPPAPPAFNCLSVRKTAQSNKKQTKLHITNTSTVAQHQIHACVPPRTTFWTERKRISHRPQTHPLSPSVRPIKTHQSLSSIFMYDTDDAPC